MPNLNAVVNEQIRRLARREITAQTKPLKKTTAHYRRAIAALKRQVAELVKLVGTLQKQMPAPAPTPPVEVVQKARLRIDGLKAHRARLGLSAKDYGKLLGVSGLTVYHWESGQSKPRRSQLLAIVAVRGLGKREALQRLRRTPGRAAPAAIREVSVKSPLQAGSKPTAQAFVFGLLRGRKVLTSAEINAAWKKAGRAANADNTLSLMVKGRKLKRSTLKGQRGSAYRLK
jgi:DNA-binding transcriptional regulator YiaG